MSDQLVDRRRHPFFMVDNVIVEDERMSHKEMAVYMVLCKYANRETSLCFPSLSTICKKTGLSKNTVIKSLNLLIEWHYISKELQFKENGAKTSNIYSINDTSKIVPLVHPVNKGSSSSEQGLVHPVNINNTNLNNTYLKSSSNAFAFYEDNHFGRLDPYITDELNYWIDKLSEEVVIYALQIAKEENKPFYYAKGTLKNWMCVNVKTLADAEKVVAEFNAKKVKTSKQRKKYDEKEFNLDD